MQDMLKLKKDYFGQFNHYVTLYQPNLDYSIEFVNYLNISHGWFDLTDSYARFIESDCDVEISDTHKQRFQELIKKLADKNLNIFEFADTSNKSAVISTIKAYKTLYSTKPKKNFKKSKKWKFINLGLILIALTYWMYVLFNS